MNGYPRSASGGGAARLADAEEVDLTVFVACYNEEANVRDTLDTVVAALREVPCSYEIIVIDDASRDRTAAVVQQYQRDHPELPVLLRVNPENQGLARNFVDGAFLGRGRHYKLVCGDNVEPAASLVNVFRLMGTADLILPYHDLCAGKRWQRVALSRLFTRLVNGISGYSVRYYNGMALYHRYHVMRWHPDCVGLGFQAELVTRLLDEGVSYREVLCPVCERQGGSSTAVTVRNVLSVGHSLFKIGCRRARRVLFGKRRRGGGAAGAAPGPRAAERVAA